jgi:hypothetical protein
MEMSPNHIDIQFTTVVIKLLLLSWLNMKLQMVPIVTYTKMVRLLTQIALCIYMVSH